MALVPPEGAGRDADARILLASPMSRSICSTYIIMARYILSLVTAVLAVLLGAAHCKTGARLIYETRRWRQLSDPRNDPARRADRMALHFRHHGGQAPCWEREMVYRGRAIVRRRI